MVFGKLVIHLQKNKVVLLPHIQNINLNWIVYFTGRAKTINLLEENIGTKLLWTEQNNFRSTAKE
jgi:hypothetical protein